jgi:hypothetical protein
MPALLSHYRPNFSIFAFTGKHGVVAMLLHTVTSRF